MAEIPVKIQLRTTDELVSKNLYVFDDFPKAPALGMPCFHDNFSSDVQKNVISVFLV